MENLTRRFAEIKQLTRNYLFSASAIGGFAISLVAWIAYYIIEFLTAILIVPVVAGATGVTVAILKIKELFD